MRLYNTFSQFLFLFVFITNCYGQEYHTDSSESTMIDVPFTEQIETTNVHPIKIEKHNILSSFYQPFNDNQHISDTFQARKEYFNKFSDLLDDEYDIEKDFQYLFPLLSFHDISSANNIDTIPALLTSKQTQINVNLFHNEDENNPVTSVFTDSNEILIKKDQQTCWCLSKTSQSNFELIENQTLHFIHLLPEFLQTSLFRHIKNPETLMNTIWFSLIGVICFLYSLFFLSMSVKRLKQNKCEKQVRAQCQQLQQHNDQIEFEYATLQRKNQKLLDEIDEMKNVSEHYKDDIGQLRQTCTQLQKDLKAKHIECHSLQNDVDYKQNLIQKHEFDMQKQMEIVSHLNNEILDYQRELEKERETIARVQSNDLSLERFEKLQEIIHELKSEITQLKQEKFSQTDQLQQVQEHNNQLDIDNNELTIKMKQLKDLLEQRDETIARIREKMMNDNHDDQEKTTEIGDFLSAVTENTSDNDQQELLSTIDNDVEKANQHMRDLHSEIDEKTRRIKEFDSLLNQEKDRCRELETKLKVVLELRERDAHLHIRQLGQTDAELRKARTDTERVRILQQQLELKQQQLDDVQKVLAIEQTKASEESGKLQHETHEKWMEVKRLTRELDGARKECEGLRRQITKYGNSDRSSQEKTMHKPETNGNSPSPLPYQQGEKSVDQSSSSSMTNSVNTSRTEPPLFVFPRPYFRPPPFRFSPGYNRFMLPTRFATSFDGSPRIVTHDDFLSINKNKT